MIEVHGPDGRVWRIARRPARPGVAGYLVPGAWRIDAVTTDERRRWLAPGLRGSGGLRDDVALALRTGSDGPPGEVAVTSDDTGPQRRRGSGDQGG
ncbi:MAG: hypothetical protein R6V28_13055 [Nitriliruptoraceae bacterium]